MKDPRRKAQGLPALDLLEEAVHLLRTAPLSALALYYAGTIPFLLAFLFFWSDMSRSALAEERVAPLAGLLALLFALMKLCHVGFGRQLRELVLGQPLPCLPWTLWLSTAALQTFWHATGLIVMPVALTILLPAGWCYAFYQNLTALGAVTNDPAENPVREAARQAQLWPKQNHLVLVIISALYPVILVNVGVVLFGIPYLFKTLLGIETGFTQGIWAIFNTTFLATVVAVAWLCLDRSLLETRLTCTSPTLGPARMK